MRICIIVFSPSGHTLKVAEKMREFMLAKNFTVQLLNITGEAKIFTEHKIKEYLKERVAAHDILCIGGPVYAGHTESNVKKIINCLPNTDDKWGQLAIPFVTYGGIHSSIALKEAGNLLYKMGRKNIMGLKIAAFHTLSASFDQKLNPEKPGKDEYDKIFEMVNRLELLLSQKNELVDVRKSFSYAPKKQQILFTLLTQDFFHKKYRPVNIISDKCIGCGKCIKVCPVKKLTLIDNKAIVSNKNVNCILCAECFFNCPNKAIDYSYMSVVQSRAKDIDKINKSLEYPQSEIYPT